MHTISDRRSGGVGSVGCLVVLFVVGLLGYMMYSMVADSTPSQSGGQTVNEQREATVKSAIPPSIVDMEEIDWVEYDGNEVYVGFNKFPLDLKPMINAWAVQANLALDFGVRVFAALNAPKGWRPGDESDGVYIGAARHGKIEN